MKDFNYALVGRLKDAKFARGCTYSEIEKVTAIKERTLKRLFTGQRDLSAFEAVTLCEFLELPLYKFFYGEQARTNTPSLSEESKSERALNIASDLESLPQDVLRVIEQQVAAMVFLARIDT